MRSHQTFVMSYRRILLLMLSLCMALAPLHSCMGEVDGANRQKAKTAQDKATGRLTRLDLSRLTFNDDISYLSPLEQKAYRECQAEFLKSLKRLPPEKQKELKEAYKWVPDVVKVIATRDYQERKKYEPYPDQRRKGYKIYPGTELYNSIKHELYRKIHRKKSEVSHPRGLFYVIDVCREIIKFRQPLAIIDTKNQEIEDVAKKCGFGYLSKMIDFCDNPNNQRKIYRNSVDKFTYDKTLEEMKAFKTIGSKYEDAIWTDFVKYSDCYNYKFWKFNLKKVDASNLTPAEYAKMEKQLKCVPPEVLIECRYKTYDSRTNNPKCIEIMNSPTYITKYAQNKGIRLSETEVQEVYQLASELLKYGTPLKLVKRDEQADLVAVAKSFGFYGISGFDFYYKRKKKNNEKIKFYQSAQEKIPYFIAEAKDFYDLGMTVNPEETKKLYQNIESDTGIVIQHQGAALDAGRGHHVDDPQNKGEEVPSGSGVHKATSLR